MTPKEKAKELVDKFAVGGWGKENAKNCVYEMIEISYPVELLQKSGLVFITEYTTEYLEDVKTEINKL